MNYNRFRLFLLIVLVYIFGVLTGQSTIKLNASPPQHLIGGTGYLNNWDVVDSDGDKICSDPYVWTGTKEIQCDSDDR